MNFFELLSLPLSFDIDLSALERAYFSLQRQYHPDRFARATPEHRMEAAQKSALANEAYLTLKDPLKRARYMLGLQGIHVAGERDTVKPPQCLLIEVMDWRERVEEATSADEIQALRAELEEIRQDCIHEFSGAYGGQDYQRAADIALKLQYCLKTLDELRTRQL